MHKTYKYRIYPTESQKKRIEQHFGACRFVYNLALETKIYAYKSQGKNLTAYDLMKQLTELKKDCPWLYDVDNSCLENSIKNLDSAYKMFFSGNGFPKFKSKYKSRKAFTYRANFASIKLNKFYQSKFRDGIKIELSRNFIGKIKRTTISKAPTGKYFISILVETIDVKPELKQIAANNSIGIDLGLKSFITTSEGHLVNNPKHFNESISKLKFLQRQLSKKKKGGANRNKARHKVALQYEKIANQRNDFLHKLSTNLIKNHDTICIEDLNIKGLIKNSNLSSAISDVSWSEFIQQLKYKAEWNGNNILQIPRFKPSTKLCSNCGELNHTLTLADREWLCVSCGILHDRDINAAINIKNYCLKIMATGRVVKSLRSCL